MGEYGLQIIATILMSCLSAFCYRLGGLGKDQAKQQIPWCPAWLINTKTRDVGCSLLAVLWMFLFFPRVEWFLYLISFGLLWGALSTYWDFFTGDDIFLLHGVGIGLALLPVVTGVDFHRGFSILMLVMPLLMEIWCRVFKNDWVEELGRGAFIVATLPLLLIN